MNSLFVESLNEMSFKLHHLGHPNIGTPFEMFGIRQNGSRKELPFIFEMPLAFRKAVLVL